MNVLKFALTNGHIIEGVCKKSWLKNGKLYDRYLTGVTKEEYKEWQQQQ